MPTTNIRYFFPITASTDADFDFATGVLFSKSQLLKGKTVSAPPIVVL